MSGEAVTMKGKIIYLGFQKCGTTSFWRFFEEHGFRVIHNTLQVCECIGLVPNPEKGSALRDLIDIEALDRFVERYDVLTDNPFPVLYEHFDKSCMDALFVLGTRPTDQWIGSMQRYFGNRIPTLGRAIYASNGNPCAEPATFCRAYEKHNMAVRDYFKGRGDFLEIRLGIDSNEKITRDLKKFASLPNDNQISFGRHLPA